MARNEIITTSGTHNVLAIGTVIKGDICAEEDFRIDGTIEGDITCKGKIIIGAQSSITGNIECTNIEMMGKVTGNICCTNNIILRASANLNGEIKSQTIEIEPGAIFSGTCSMLTE
ncbi:polymer-forming cytoskeletal protein [Dysgonomonas sp. ZJ709]|uniref:bactofilin family protein n=1 Tax=Dysgonomonas sp. ZJ709 TaxID=2709797 RepID=UPI0013EA7C29|nr:polymer-forming cytoskeletal protein [Dysgonomonas sp. ZJ709]